MILKMYLEKQQIKMPQIIEGPKLTVASQNESFLENQITNLKYIESILDHH